jgi:hypothetical protein
MNRTELSEAFERSVDEFLLSYRSAFETFDPDRIVDCFAEPVYIASDADEVSSVCVPNAEAWHAQIVRLLDVYRKIGVVSARSAQTTVSAVSARLLAVHVRWELRGANDAPIYEFDASYTLGSMNGQWKIMAIAHNEVPRIREALARVASK